MKEICMKDHPALGIINGMYDTNRELKALSIKILTSIRDGYKDIEQIVITDNGTEDEIRLRIGALSFFVRTLYGLNCVYVEFGLYATEPDKIHRHIMQEFIIDSMGNLLKNGKNISREFHLLGLTVIKNMILRIEKEKCIKMPLSKDDIDRLNAQYTDKAVLEI